MKVAQSWFMFGFLFEMRYLNKFFKLDDFVDEVFMLTFPMSYLAILYFVDLSLILRVRAVTNRFPDPPILSFEPDDVVSIISHYRE